MIGAGVTDMIAEAIVARKLETTGHEILKSIHPTIVRGCYGSGC
jgi:dihydrolipoamide dehydrogenase